MCGIAGFADKRAQSCWPGGLESQDDADARLRAMCASIRHRGPDDEGRHLEPGVALGMRRDTRAAARDEYAVCCSAYGGHNTAPTDPYNIRRIVISTSVTFLAFRAHLEGWPMVRLTNPYREPSAAIGEAVAS